MEKSFKDIRLDLPIAAEYPLVLDQGHLEFSWGFFDDQGVLRAHANLWPRKIVTNDAEKCADDLERDCLWVGLIGNVVTDADFRGLGLMRRLFEHLKAEAIDHGWYKLLLWSDLDDFYHKVGFTKMGRETRFFLDPGVVLEKYRGDLTGQVTLVTQTPQAVLSAINLPELLNIRYKVQYTLERTLSEFAKLLTIPQTKIISYRDHQRSFFGLMGRGSDLQNVVYEWGSSDAEAFLGLIATAAQNCDYDQLIFLAPANLNHEIRENLTSVAAAFEEFPLCLGWQNPNMTTRQKLEEGLFIWGLDSI